ncbi:MAG TPA: aminopeptidase [Burkholderiaceae bacterium]|nr:aminopeptidase [Burkholderiaceae bacterium]
MKRWVRVAGIGIVGVAALLGAACLTVGCSTIGYYAQSVGGHLDLVARARPIGELAADPAAPAALRERLALAARIRDFAVSDLGLPDNRSYRRYSDLGRPAAVWNVVAAPELSLKLETWCFAVVGCVGYRGYYERAAAESESERLRARGLEVSVYGVPAYSTLGKLDWLGGDPLLNTFIGWPEGELARLVFHELAHQVVFAKDDTVFNESFATAVERIGVQRWLARHASEEALRQYAQLDARRNAFRALTGRYRARLEALYASPADDDQRRRDKAALMAALRADYAALKADPSSPLAGFAGYDGWFERANNASFGVLAAYNELVPGFERLFEREGRDFGRFYATVARLAALPKAERHATLNAP